MEAVPRGEVETVMLKLKIAGAIILAILLCALSAYITYTITKPSTVTIFGTAAVLKQVQQMNELVSVKYVIEKVVGMKDENFFGKDQLLLIAHGIAKAGVRLDELKPEDVRVSAEGEVTLRLPKARIL